MRFLQSIQMLQALLNYSADGRLSNYVLNLTNVSNVMLVQLYQGAKGTNGPVDAILHKSLIMEPK